MGKADAAQKQIELGRSLLKDQDEFKHAEFEVVCGNSEQAARLLKIALVKKQVTLQEVHSNPNFNPIQQDPDFQNLMGS